MSPEPAAVRNAPTPVRDACSPAVGRMHVSTAAPPGTPPVPRREDRMGQRTVGIDLAIRGDHVARILDDGRPSGRPIRFRLTSDSLDRLVAALHDGLALGATVIAV